MAECRPERLLSIPAVRICIRLWPDHGPGARIPALDLTKIDPDLLRQHVRFAGPYRPGTIVVNVADADSIGFTRRHGDPLYGRRRPQGSAQFSRLGRHRQKAESPHWTPTGDIIRRMPIYAHYVNGLPGGIGNPLGARALYLYRGNQDTYFRLHGTNEPDTIGTKVSSGCIRLFNHDIIDLYNRVPVGAPVIVLQEGKSPLSATAGAGGYGPGGYRPGGYQAEVMRPAATDRVVMDRAAMERVGMERAVMERRVITVHTLPDRPGPTMSRRTGSNDSGGFAYATRQGGSRPLRSDDRTRRQPGF